MSLKETCFVQFFDDPAKNFVTPGLTNIGVPIGDAYGATRRGAYFLKKTAFSRRWRLM